MALCRLGKQYGVALSSPRIRSLVGTAMLPWPPCDGDVHAAVASEMKSFGQVCAWTFVGTFNGVKRELWVTRSEDGINNRQIPCGAGIP